MRIVFMGTPEIARHCLDVLLQSEHEVVAVYTRRDKPVGRKQVLTPPAVKQLACEKGISVFQPANLRGEETLSQLRALNPDVIVVVAYGCIAPAGVLKLPRHGCLNVHVSCLPKYRGAAPIQWAVIDGCKKTGVSIMQLDEGLDTGPLYATEEFAIQEDATAGEVLWQATQVGAQLLLRTLNKVEQGSAIARPQSGEASLAPSLHKGMASLDFKLPATKLHNLVRGCNPWPGTWFITGGKKIKVMKTRVCNLQGNVGEVLQLNPLVVACGEDALELIEIVPEGKKPMSGTQWAQGKRLQKNDRFDGVFTQENV